MGYYAEADLTYGVPLQDLFQNHVDGDEQEALFEEDQWPKAWQVAADKHGCTLVRVSVGDYRWELVDQALPILTHKDIKQFYTAGRYDEVISIPPVDPVIGKALYDCALEMSVPEPKVGWILSAHFG